ncbi:MAG: ATP-binding protein [Bacteroidota bacterium]
MLVKEQEKVNCQTKLNFSSVPENLALVEKLIDEICENYCVNEDYYGNILISITEAVNNAIQHGNKYDPNKSVDVVFESDSETLYFTVVDEGEGFDYNKLPDPTDPENIEKIEGRGIFLMKNLADGVEFSKNGSIVELNFKKSAN